jgi:hypothetical protein
MDFLGYLLFGILLAIAFSPKWLGEWLAKVRNAFDANRQRSLP